MALTRKEAQSLLLKASHKRAGSSATKRGGSNVGNRHLGPGVNNLREEFLVEAIHNKDISEKFVQTLQDIMDGKKRIEDGLHAGIIPSLLELMVQLKTSPSEKQRMEAARDFLDRTGHGKQTKVHNTGEGLSPTADPLELISAISGLMRDTRIESATDADYEDAE